MHKASILMTRVLATHGCRQFHASCLQMVSAYRKCERIGVLTKGRIVRQCKGRMADMSSYSSRALPDDDPSMSTSVKFYSSCTHGVQE